MGCKVQQRGGHACLDPPFTQFGEQIGSRKGNTVRQITYISTLRAGHDSGAFAEIERQSLRRNATAGLSGLLLFDGRRFLQVLEGAEEAVAETYARIGRDPRHHAVVVLADKQVAAPSFGGWAMLCRDVTRPEQDLGALLQPYLAQADRNTKATFESFAEIRARNVAA